MSTNTPRTATGRRTAESDSATAAPSSTVENTGAAAPAVAMFATPRVVALTTWTAKAMSSPATNSPNTSAPEVSLAPSRCTVCEPTPAEKEIPPEVGRTTVWKRSSMWSATGTLSPTRSTVRRTPRARRTHVLPSHCHPGGRVSRVVNRSRRPTVSSGMKALMPAAADKPRPVSAAIMNPPELARKVTTVEQDSGTSADRIWTVPNLISMVRLLLVPVVAMLIFTGENLAAVIVLAVAGVSDYVDGWVARRFNQMSNFGKLLDPAADRLFIAVTLIGIAARDLIPWWLVVAIGSRELLVGLTLPVLGRRGFTGYPVHLAGKAGTMALMYAFPLLLLAGMDGLLGDVAYVVGWAAAMWGVYLY